MCGIFGFVVKKPSESNYTQFRRLMIASSHRGRDATGFAVVNAKKEIFLHKEPLHPKDYIEKELPRFKDVINNGVIVIGHIREATQGEPKDNDNNHPVESATWLMIHNGGVYSIPRLAGYKYKGEVDTEVFLSYVETKGLQEGLPYLGYGSGAVVLINKEDPTYLVLARYTSPICVSLNGKETILSFASEESILKAVVDKHFCFFTDHQFATILERVAYKITQNPLKAERLFAFETKSAPPSYTTSEKWVSWWNKKDDKDKVDSVVDVSNSAIEDMVPDEVEDSNRNAFFFLPEEKVWVNEDIKRKLVIDKDKEGNKVANRYYFKGTAKDFKDWYKVPGLTKGWVSQDKVLFKKYDSDKKAHFIMLTKDALSESEATLVPSLSYVKKKMCEARIFLDDSDQIIGYALTVSETAKIEHKKEEEIRSTEHILPSRYFIDLSDVPINLLLFYDKTNPTSSEEIMRYAVEKFEDVEDTILQILLEESAGKLVKDAEIDEPVTNNLPVVFKEATICAGYDSLIGKEKVMSCLYCKNYNLCSSNIGEGV